MSYIGQLIQPRVLVRWGDVELTFDSEQTEFSALQGVSMQFQDAEAYPTCSLNFTSDVIGYNTYRKCVSEFRDSPIIISVGYPQGSWFSAQFFFSGAQLGVGNSGEISISGSSKEKEYLSSFKTSLSVETTLKELVDSVQQSSVKNPDSKSLVSAKFTTLADRISGETKLHGIVGSGLTPGRILIQHLENKGLKLGLWATADPNEPKATIHSSPVADAGESADQPVERPLSNQLSLGDESYGFLLGPGLIREVSRGIQSNPDGTGGSSASNKPSKTEDPNAPDGFNAQSPQETVTEETNKGFEQTLKAAREQEGNFTMSGSCFMVPQVVGMKPRDFIFIPSLLGDYMEDWCLDSVSYEFGASGAQLSFNGFRVDVEPGQKMVDTETYLKFAEKLKSLSSLEDWEKYYWRG